MTREQIIAANETLAALILPWAKEKHPSKYSDTVKAVRKPDVFRRYMVRLVEIRVEEEPEFRGQVPLSILDETKLTARFKRGDYEFEVRGAGSVKSQGPRVWCWTELALTPEQFEERRAWKEALELERVEGDSDEPQQSTAITREVRGRLQ